MPVVKRVAQLIDRHIKTEHGHDSPLLIMDGEDISHQVQIRNGITIAIRPYRGIRRIDGFVVTVLGIVATFGCNLCVLDLPMVPPDIGFEQSSFFREIVGYVGHPAARHVGMRLEHPLHHRIRRVRMEQVPFQVPDMSHQRIFRKIQGILEDDGLDRQFRLGPFFQLICQQTARIVILHSRQSLQQNRRSDDDY